MNDWAPLVGVVGSEGRRPAPGSDRPLLSVPEDYLQAVADGGGMPVVVPVGFPVDGLVTALDALVLCGGPDVDPARYGASRDERTSPPQTRRDTTEIELVGAAGRLGLPLLAICRGMQVLNVARGGTLVQHLPDRVGHDGHAPAPGQFGRHEVTPVARTVLASVLGSASIEVESAHHQATDRLGNDLVVSAVASDGTIEAIEDPEQGFLVGVQWHPEVGTDRRLFRALVAAATNRRESQASPARR